MKRKKILALLASLLFLAVSGQLFIWFLLYHQDNINKSGYAFNDSVLNLFPRGDFSIYIFGITYSSLIIYILLRCAKINELSKFALAYGLILLTRIITLSLVPLREPIGLVSLNEVYEHMIFDGEITADLFYSGHTECNQILKLSKKYIFSHFRNRSWSSFNDATRSLFYRYCSGNSICIPDSQVSNLDV